MKKQGRNGWMPTVLASMLLVFAGVGVSAQQNDAVDSLDICTLLAESMDNWSQSADDFAVEYGKNGFRFSENRRRDVVVSRTHGAVNCFGIPVMEARVYFRNRAVHAIDLSVYNKGDATGLGRTVSLDELSGIVEQVSKRISGTTKMPQIRRVRVKNDRAKMGHKFTRSWPDRVPAAELTWGVSGDDEAQRVEYIRLTFKSGAKPSRDSAKSQSRTGRKSSASRFADNVRRSDEGDTYVANIPMVDQGDKGYCAAAAAERVLRYFGQTIDEHEIAQVAGTSAESGTSTKSMISAVETIGKKCKLGMREIVAKIGSWEDGARQLKEYNKTAKRMKRPELDINDYITVEGSTRTFHIGDMQRAMEAKVLKSMSMRDKSGYKKFIAGIREQTNRGVPLFWSVRMGIYPEAGVLQAAGGHMRLVIGYNEEKEEVIYTDTWGAGHERKYMPSDWAWTITHNLFYLNPR